MSNAEAVFPPVPIETRPLIRLEALPVERHPAAVYLSPLGSGSRRSMRPSLEVIAGLLSGGRADIRDLAWEKLRYQHTQAIRIALSEKFAAGTTNKMHRQGRKRKERQGSPIKDKGGGNDPDFRSLPGGAGRVQGTAGR